MNSQYKKNRLAAIKVFGYENKIDCGSVFFQYANEFTTAFLMEEVCSISEFSKKFGVSKRTVVSFSNSFKTNFSNNNVIHNGLTYIELFEIYRNSL